MTLQKLQTKRSENYQNLTLSVGGFPCQAFSIAGKRRGFEDARGTLFYQIARFAKIAKPSYLFLENVTGLLNHQGGGETFKTILTVLDEIGYNAEWQVLNSKDYVPQNRERVFIIGHLRGGRTRQVFPIERENRSAIESKQQKQVAIPVLTPDRIEKRQNGRRFKEVGEEMFTLTAQDRHGVMVAGTLPGNHDYQIRKLTPRECWRLQGFPDWAFDCAKEVNSDSQLYKQAGNSVTVPVIYDIAKELRSR